MSILLDARSRVLVQGITGQAGRAHARRCLDYGTQVVAGVTPGKGGASVEGVPVFDTVRAAVQATGADTSLLFVPAPAAASAMAEAAEAGIKLLICITEGVPVLDMVKVKKVLEERGARLIGPNGPGVMTPGDAIRRGALAGIMPADIHRPGPVGVVSRSGTLTYEAVHQLTRAGVGQSTVVGIGGDAVVGTGFADVLALFEDDPGTEAVLLIGEIGGAQEEDAARFFKSRMRKPLFAYVAGRSAPAGKRMGHAGAVAGEGDDGADAKRRVLAAAGVRVIDSPSAIGDAVARVLRPMARTLS